MSVNFQKMVEDAFKEAGNKAVREAQTTDAEPVKHGMWKAGVTCSECGFVRQTTRNGNPMVGRYCPYCGAKMGLKKGEGK